MKFIGKSIEETKKRRKNERVNISLSLTPPRYKHAQKYVQSIKREAKLSRSHKGRIAICFLVLNLKLVTRQQQRTLARLRPLFLFYQDKKMFTQE
jgi:Holliday junction resolvase RusA-like endonuclease